MDAWPVTGCCVPEPRWCSVIEVVCEYFRGVCVYVCVLLTMETKASHMLGKPSTTEQKLQHFSTFYWRLSLILLPQAILEFDSPASTF